MEDVEKDDLSSDEVDYEASGEEAIMDQEIKKKKKKKCKRKRNGLSAEESQARNAALSLEAGEVLETLEFGSVEDQLAMVKMVANVECYNYDFCRWFRNAKVLRSHKQFKVVYKVEKRLVGPAEGLKFSLFTSALHNLYNKTKKENKRELLNWKIYTQAVTSHHQSARDFKRSLHTYGQSKVNMRVLISTGDRFDEKMAELDGKRTYEGYNPDLPEWEHVRRIGKELGKAAIPYKDGVLCQGDYLPRIPQSELGTRIDRYHHYRDIRLLEEKKLQPNYVEPPYDSLSELSASEFDENDSILPVGVVPKNERCYFDIVLDRDYVSKYPQLLYLLEESRDPNEFLQTPLDLDNLPLDVAITWRMDLAGHSRWPKIRSRLIRGVDASVRNRYKWVPRGGPRATDKKTTVAVGFGERPDMQGGVGLYYNFKDKLPDTAIPEYLAAVVRKIRINIKTEQLKKKSRKKFLVEQFVLLEEALQEIDNFMTPEFCQSIEDRRYLIELETYAADQTAAVTKANFPTRFESEVEDTRDTGSSSIGYAKRSAWFGAVHNYLCGQHVEVRKSEEEWTTAFALGWSDFDQANPNRRGSSFILSKVGKYGLILEGGEGVISSWRAQKDRHGTGLSRDGYRNLRLSGGVREVGLCETRKLYTSGRNSDRLAREEARIEQRGRAVARRGRGGAVGGGVGDIPVGPAMYRGIDLGL